MVHITSVDALYDHCNEMLLRFDKSHWAHMSEFVRMAYKISKKYPFVLIQDFLKDLVNGTPRNMMLEKYHLYDHNDLKSITDTLRISGQGTKGSSTNNVRHRLQNPQYKKH